MVDLSITVNNLYCNQPVMEAVWDYAYDRVGYLGNQYPIDHCYACDFEGDFEPTERGFASKLRE